MLDRQAGARLWDLGSNPACSVDSLRHCHHRDLVGAITIRSIYMLRPEKGPLLPARPRYGSIQAFPKVTAPLSFRKIHQWVSHAPDRPWGTGRSPTKRTTHPFVSVPRARRIGRRLADPRHRARKLGSACGATTWEVGQHHNCSVHAAAARPSLRAPSSSCARNHTFRGSGATKVAAGDPSAHRKRCRNKARWMTTYRPRAAWQLCTLGSAMRHCRSGPWVVNRFPRWELRVAEPDCCPGTVPRSWAGLADHQEAHAERWEPDTRSQAQRLR